MGCYHLIYQIKKPPRKIDMIHDGINQILNYMKNGARTEDAKLLLDASESMKDRSNSIVNANDQNIHNLILLNLLVQHHQLQYYNNYFPTNVIH